MDPTRLGQLARQFAQRRLSRRAALATGGAGVGALLFRDRLGPRRASARKRRRRLRQRRRPPRAPTCRRTCRPGCSIPGAPASPYGERAPAEQGVVRLAPAPDVSFSPLADLHGTQTPNALWYEVHYGGIPAIDPTEHRLLVHGLVNRPTLFTMDDLKRFPAVSVDALSRMLRQLVLGVDRGDEGQDGPAIARLDQLRRMDRRAGRDDLARSRARSRAAAGCWRKGRTPPATTARIPTAKAMADGLLAYAVNGEALRPSQGYPLRLAAARVRGQHQREVAAPAQDRRASRGRPGKKTSHYTDLMPDGTARQFTFVMEAKSVITSPSGGQQLAGPGFVEISGLAWSGRGRIDAVEVSTDGGASWSLATLQAPVLPIAWTRFRFPWMWDGKPARLQSRAIDETGYVQPTPAQLVATRGTNSFYHFNGITTWAIAAQWGGEHVYA